MRKSTTVTLAGKLLALKTEETYVDESSRIERATNLAKFLRENWLALRQLGQAINTKSLRTVFIACVGDFVHDKQGDLLKKLLLSSAPTQDVHGDMRATGDALGGHLLKLEIVSGSLPGGKKERILKLNEKNHAKISAFLESVKKPDVIR